MRRRRTVEFKPDQPDQPKAVKRQGWEYLEVRVQYSHELKDLGIAGWELCCLSQDDYGKRTFFMKRKLPSLGQAV